MIKAIKKFNWISLFLSSFAIIVIIASFVATEKKENHTVSQENTIIQPSSVNNVDYATDEYVFTESQCDS